MSRNLPPAAEPQPEQCKDINAYLTSPAAEATITKDIAALNENIECINKLFEKVMGPLESFDRKYLSFDAPDCLAPKWRHFWERFEDYVRLSRKTAAEAFAVMHSYADAVLGNVGKDDCDVQQLGAEINDFHEKVQQHLSSADVVHVNFKQLARDIGNFERTVEHTVVRVCGPLPTGMSKTCDDIEALKKKVATISEEKSNHQARYMESVATLAPSAAKMLCLLSPTAVIEALRSIFTETKDVDKVAEAQGELAQFSAQIPGLLESAKMPPEICPFYRDWWANTQNDIRTVALRIETISRIWDTLNTDLVLMKTYMGLCVSKAIVANNHFLMDKIKISRQTFIRLTQCLELYVTQLPPTSA